MPPTPIGTTGAGRPTGCVGAVETADADPVRCARGTGCRADPQPPGSRWVEPRPGSSVRVSSSSTGSLSLCSAHSRRADMKAQAIPTAARRSKAMVAATMRVRSRVGAPAVGGVQDGGMVQDATPRSPVVAEVVDPTCGRSYDRGPASPVRHRWWALLSSNRWKDGRFPDAARAGMAILDLCPRAGSIAVRASLHEHRHGCGPAPGVPAGLGVVAAGTADRTRGLRRRSGRRQRDRGGRDCCRM